MIGLLFRALTGFALATSVLYSGALESRIGPARLAALKADIAAQHPAARLQAQIDDTLGQLETRIATPADTAHSRPH